MKKVLFMISVAAVTFASCSNESTEYVGSGPEQKEIAFSPLVQKATRSTTDGAVFNTGYDIQVAAYDISNTREFFSEKTFGYVSADTWKSTPPTYWPLSPTSISFLAYTELNPADATPVTWTNTQQVVLKMKNNSSTQKDLMYACGYGAVTANGTNGLNFPTDVDMTFYHAQAWVAFTVNTDASSSGKIKLKSIKLNGAKYQGQYTVTHAGWNSTTLGDHSVSGTWSNIEVGFTGANEVVVPGWAGASTAITYESTPANVPFVGNGLLVVPDDTNSTPDFTSFTITYELDSKEYTYTYTPASTDLEQKKKYIFNITFKLHEIVIDPEVSPWGAGGSTDVDII